MIFLNERPDPHVHVFKAGATFEVDLQFFKASEPKGNISKVEIRKACRLVCENAAVLRKNGKRFMAKFKEMTDAQIAKARAEGRAFQRDPSYATGVEYDEDRDRIAIHFRCGGTISVPRRSYPGLEKQKPIGPITVLGGDGLDVEAMDLQVYIPGLIEHVFGPRLITRAAMVYAGRQKSEAKARAARLNGRKGGRPRKNRAA